MNIYKTSNEIRHLFLKFFKINNHKIVKSSSLIPYNDNSILFTNSGMNQFKDILLGNKISKYKNIVTIQKCIRAGGKHNDLDQVGLTNKHHTFFEMLGNFSFGNYFKEESICFAFDLITNKNWFNIPKNKLIITTHKMDEESYKLWIKLGIKRDKIIQIGSKKNYILSDNFWKMSEYGPCGPSSEIFFNKNNNFNIKNSIKDFLDKECIEIWNLVFMEFNKNDKNNLVSLPHKSIDTGMGLERISLVLQNVNSNYDTDIFNKIKNILYKYFDSNNINSFNIICDHIRSIIFIINEEIYPSNTGRGYILRKIIRRAISNVIILGKNEPFLYKIIDYIPNIMFPYKYEILNNIKNIKNVVYEEECKFFKVINYGIKILENKIKNNILKKISYIDSSFIFKLYDTYGLPIYLINNFLFKKNILYNINEYNNLMNIQKNKSKINNKFKKI